MSSQQYLLKRRQAWYVRVPVPLSAQAALGDRKEIVRSLKTRDLKEAKQRRHATMASIYEVINEAVRTKNSEPQSVEWLKLQMRRLIKDHTDGVIVCRIGAVFLFVEVLS